MIPTELELAYIAGFVDGEGCISVSNSHVVAGDVRLHAVQATPEVIEWINARLPGKVNMYQSAKYNPNARPTYKWQLNGQKALPVLRCLEPFLIVKRLQATLAIELLETCMTGSGPGKQRTEIQEQRATEIMEQVKRLNKRGVK